MLVWTALLCLLIPAIYLTGEMVTPGGMEWGLGNRDVPLELPPWAARAKRAHAEPGREPGAVRRSSFWSPTSRARPTG